MTAPGPTSCERHHDRLPELWHPQPCWSTCGAPEVSARLGVQGIPTMVLYDRGSEIGRQVGALPGPAIRQWVERELASATT
jgi:hypothetical protein